MEGRPSTGPGTKEAAGFPGEEGCGTLSSGPCSLQGPRPCRGQTNKRIAQRRIRLPFEVSLPLIDLPRSCPALASARRFLRSEERDTFCYWAGATKGSSRRRGLTAIPSGAIACAPALLADPRRGCSAPGSGRRTGGERRLARAAPGAPAPLLPARAPGAVDRPNACRQSFKVEWTAHDSPLPCGFVQKGKRSDCRNHRTALPFADSAAAPLHKAPRLARLGGRTSRAEPARPPSLRPCQKCVKNFLSQIATSTENPAMCGASVSGRRDLNSGPLVPQTSALTRLRHAPWRSRY